MSGGDHAINARRYAAVLLLARYALIAQAKENKTEENTSLVEISSYKGLYVPTRKCPKVWWRIRKIINSFKSFLRKGFDLVKQERANYSKCVAVAIYRDVRFSTFIFMNANLLMFGTLDSWR